MGCSNYVENHTLKCCRLADALFEICRHDQGNIDENHVPQKINKFRKYFVFFLKTESVPIFLNNPIRFFNNLIRLSKTPSSDF